MKSTLSFFAMILICNCIVMTSCQNNIPKTSQDKTSNTNKNKQTPIDDQYAYQEEVITIIRDVTPPSPVLREVPEEEIAMEEEPIMMDQDIFEVEEDEVEVEVEISDAEIFPHTSTRKKPHLKKHKGIHALQHNTEEYNHIVEN